MPMPMRAIRKTIESRFNSPKRERCPAKRPSDADSQRQLRRQRQPDRSEHDHQPDEDRDPRRDFGFARIFVGLFHLVGVERRTPGCIQLETRENPPRLCACGANRSNRFRHRR